MVTAKSGHLVAEYLYPDERGRVLLRKRRYEPKDFRLKARRREGYKWVPPSVLMERYPGARPYFAGLLYRLPELLSGASWHSSPGAFPWTAKQTSGAVVYWTEGEKDADAIIAAGGAATTHWQGAGNATEDQAAWFARYSGWVALIADRDPPGALDAVRRFALLRSAGIGSHRIVVVRAATGKDAADHFAAGHSLHEFRAVDRKRLRAVARQCESSAFRSAGYLTPEERADLADWRPRVVRGGERS